MELVQNSQSEPNPGAGEPICFEDMGDVGSWFTDNERMSASLGTKESIWQDWLDRNSRRHRRLTADLQKDMPGVLGALIPAQNGDMADIGIWAFYLDCITDFLAELPAYYEDNDINDRGVGYSAEMGGVPWDEMYLYFSALMAALYDSPALENASLGKACAVLEQLELWPREACDWMVWLSRLGRFVQPKANCRHFLQVLEYLIELTAHEEIPHFTAAAREEMRVVLQGLRRFINKCAWSYA